MSNKTTIPLGRVSSAEVREGEYRQYPRRKNWNAPEPSTIDDRYSWSLKENMGRYSSRCTFTRWEYTPKVTCYAVILEERKLEFHWTDQVFLLTSPRGYRWDKDESGIRLVSLSVLDKDYHPNSDDLLFYKRSEMSATINRLYSQRLEVKRKAREDKARVRRAEKEGAMICLRDSLKAGNCEVGTLSFAKRHGLDPKRHYLPTTLLKIANGDTHRVQLAVVIGLRRHRKEMQQGFALLEDHC